MLDLLDRGLAYGDGLFETLRVTGGACEYWDEHMKRLEEGCARLGIPAPDRALLKQEANRLTTGNMVLKILITRGSGGRGYRPPNDPHPTRIFLGAPLPPNLAQMAEQGVRVRYCQTRLSDQPHLARIKHCNRLEQIIARAEWQDDTIQEGILFDRYDRAIEAISANLFLIRDETLITPKLIHCGIAGILRGIILDRARHSGISTLCRTVPRVEIDQCQEMFLTNSIIGVVPIRQCQERNLTIGPMTRRVQKLIGTPTRP